MIIYIPTILDMYRIDRLNFKLRLRAILILELLHRLHNTLRKIHKSHIKFENAS